MGSPTARGEKPLILQKAVIVGQFFGDEIFYPPRVKLYTGRILEDRIFKSVIFPRC